MRNWIINLFVTVIAFALILIFSEAIFRLLIFGNSATFNSLRKPEFYTSGEYEEDFWKLRVLFNWKNDAFCAFPQLSKLGWIGNFESNTFKHNEFANVGTKKAVLWYGDSFAKCVDSTLSFNEILNHDSAFSSHHYLLNYGEFGYGTDQSYLLLKESLKYYKNPFVVFSFLTNDLQRSTFHFRDGHKPYLRIAGDSLVFETGSVGVHTDDYVNNNPPQISSYLYRKLIYDKRLYSVFPFLEFQKNKLEQKKIPYVKQLNEKIFDETLNLMNINRAPFVFVVFCSFTDFESGMTWQEDFAVDYFKRKKVPYILVRDIIKDFLTKNPTLKNQIFIPGDGHHTSLMNLQIADRIKEIILKSSSTN
ncbi:MAG TPA: hypothetical protein PKN75_00940 [Bacteroidia bacterium]|nr:hypothetical protein [Bacteroidia bacterium]HNU32138.1 hypothetical protein [Bacteroidia bacterium]